MAKVASLWARLPIDKSRFARELRQASPPHLEFVDMGGHGYAIVTADAERIVTEFVCIPRPITSAARPDGGPLRYRVVHTAARWKAGEKPRLAQSVIDGDVSLSM